MGKTDLTVGAVPVGGALAVAGVVQAVEPNGVQGKEPAGGWPADVYTGKPGTYVRDPATGVRSPLPGDPEAAQVVAQLALEAQAAQKEDRRVAALMAVAKAKL